MRRESFSSSSPPPSPRRPGQGESVGKGIGFTGGSRVGGQLFQFLASLVLARLLTPSDYGTYALIVTISAFALLLNDFGIKETLIRQKELFRWHADAGFWVNIGVGAVLFALLASTAPLTAELFDDPQLRWMLPLASLVFVIGPNTVPIAILQRSRRFGLIGLAEVLNVIVTSVVAIAFAAAGFGAVSLVVGMLLGTAMMTTVLWSEVHWRIGRPNVREIRSIFSGSSGNVGFSVATLVGHSIDTLAAGVVSGPSGLGAYNRAYNLSRMPGGLVGSVLNRVLLPVYGELRESPDEMRRTWRLYTRRTLMLLVPGAAVLSTQSEAMVGILYGPGWLESAKYLTVLAWIIPAFAFASAIGPFLFLMSRQRTIFAVGLAQAVIFVVAVSIGAVWGLRGIVWGVLVASFLGHAPLVAVCMHSSKIAIGLVFEAIWPAAVVTGVVTAAGVALTATAGGAVALIAAILIYVIATLAVTLLTDWRFRMSVTSRLRQR